MCSRKSLCVVVVILVLSLTGLFSVKSLINRRPHEPIESIDCRIRVSDTDTPVCDECIHIHNAEGESVHCDSVNTHRDVLHCWEYALVELFCDIDNATVLLNECILVQMSYIIGNYTARSMGHETVQTFSDTETDTVESSKHEVVDIYFGIKTDTVECMYYMPVQIYRNISTRPLSAYEMSPCIISRFGNRNLETKQTKAAKVEDNSARQSKNETCAINYFLCKRTMPLLENDMEQSFNNSNRTVQHPDGQLSKCDTPRDIRTQNKILLVLLIACARNIVMYVYTLLTQKYFKKGDTFSFKTLFLLRRFFKKSILTNAQSQLKTYYKSHHKDQDTLGEPSYFPTTKSFIPAVQEYVVAPVTELGDYFETMSSFKSSDVDTSLNIEFLRIETFRTFPHSCSVSTIRMAENGLFHTGKSDEVECFHCHVRYSNWKKGDIPSEVHKAISPDCDFVRGSTTGNVALLGSSRPLRDIQDGASPEPETHYQEFIPRGPPEHNINDDLLFNNLPKTCQENKVENEPKTESNCVGILEASPLTIPEERNTPHLDRKCKSQDEWRRTYSGQLRLPPIGTVRKALTYPGYAIMTVRLSSYKGWSSSSGLTPKSLAEAGFMYAGYGDLVRCYCCGGGLRNWLPSDDPWIEHARWFPECTFLRQSKGDNFIMLVHEDVKVPQTVRQHAPALRKSTTENGYKAPARRHDLDPVYQRVLEMGYSVDNITSAMTSLSIQRRPIDVFNIVNALCNENHAGPAVDVYDGQRVPSSVTSGQLHGSPSIQQSKDVTVDKRCKICLEDDVAVTFLPCNHVICCRACSSIVYRCPVCRQTIKERRDTALY